MSTAAVLDANVLANAAVRDTLLRAAERDMYRLVLTAQILEEMRRALESNLGRTRAETRYLVKEIRNSFASNFVDGYASLVEMMSNAPEDRHVLAAAVCARAETIVTFNTRHFPAAACEPYGVEADHPDGFLLDLWQTDPRAMAAIIVEQAEDLPGWTADGLVVRLARDVPEFAHTLMLGLDIGG